MQLTSYDCKVKTEIRKLHIHKNEHTSNKPNHTKQTNSFPHEFLSTFALHYVTIEEFTFINRFVDIKTVGGVPENLSSD